MVILQSGKCHERFRSLRWVVIEVRARVLDALQERAITFLSRISVLVKKITRARQQRSNALHDSTNAVPTFDGVAPSSRPFVAKNSRSWYRLDPDSRDCRASGYLGAHRWLPNPASPPRKRRKFCRRGASAADEIFHIRLYAAASVSRQKWSGISLEALLVPPRVLGEPHATVWKATERR